MDRRTRQRFGILDKIMDTAYSVLREQEQREAVVLEARSWIGTPYHLTGRVKGAGVDCATLLAEVLIACGLSEREDFGFYSHDWFHHTEEDRYLFRMMRHAAKTAETVSSLSMNVQPGNLVLAKLVGSRVYNHGAIVVNWPRIVHAMDPEVVEVDILRDPFWSNKVVAIFDPWNKPKQ